MTNFLFVLVLCLLLAVIYTWGFGRLSRERWQFVGLIPTAKQKNGQWHGLNLTYYGLFNACACTLAVMVVYTLLASAEISFPAINMILAVIMAFCIPAAKLVARWVEKKAHTFSIGGAAFVGLMAGPWLMVLLNHLFSRWGMAAFSVSTALAAIAVAYALGEGCGRLACISFGCCYGKPMADLSPFWRRLLTPFSMTYDGHTKKIAYADDLHQHKVVAVQAITAVVYSLAGMAGILLFAAGHAPWAYLLCALITQVWRFGSEFLRADFRGAGHISAYQKMALLTVPYAFATFAWMPAAGSATDLLQGLRLLWNPGIILLCQFLWIGIFLYTGRSQVTGARISFHVRRDRI